MYTKSVRFTAARLVLILTLVLMTIALYPALSAIVQAQNQNFAATLSPVAGLVQYLAKDSNDWVTLTDKQLINEGDQIRTGSNGFAHLTLITGVDIELFPTTQISATSLKLGQDSGQVVNIAQVVGMTFNSVKSTRPNDQVAIFLPTANVLVTGADFYTFVTSTLHAAVFSQTNKVQVNTGNSQTYNVDPNNFAYMTLDASSAGATCTIELLNTVQSQLVGSPIVGDQNKEQAFRNLLHDFLISNLNPQARAYLRKQLGLPAVDLSKASPADDDKALQELLDQIDKSDLKNINLAAFLASFRTYWETTYKGTLKADLAPTTCGNGKQDDGETAQNCPDDFTNTASCGNGICETDRQDVHESVISCPADCLAHGDLALSCTNMIPIPPTATQVPFIRRPPTKTPVPTSTPTPQPPHPSGVG